MKKTRILALFLALVMVVCSLPLSVLAADNGTAVYDTAIETELADYLLYQTTYVDNTYVGATAKVSVYTDTAKNGKAIPTDKRDTIIYVKNWNGERIGTENDVSIVKSYIEADASVETKNKAVVIVVDYGYSGGEYAKNSVVGKIEHSIGAYRKNVLTDGKLELGGSSYISLNASVVYILPEGYRVERDILFWESDFHSQKGTLGAVLDAWNTEIANPSDNNYRQVYYDYYVEGDEIPAWEAEGTTVGSPKHDENGNVILYDPDGNGIPDLHGAPKVSRVEDCVKRYGDPMDYNIRLDIIHPSFEKDEDKVETPVFMVAATQSPRFKNILDGNRNYFGAFTFGGCTGVAFDYAYIPTAREDHYGYNDKYGTHGYNAAKWSRAAVRCVRYYAEALGYSDELIAAAGISKGTPTTSILSLNHNELAPEKAYYAASNNGTLFEGGENIYQPYSTYDGAYDGKGGNPGENPETEMAKTGAIDSNVTVVYCAAGDGIDWQYQDTSIRKHVEQYGNVPMALSCGQNDEYGCWNRYDDIVASKTELATSVYLSMPMEDKGHEYPNGIDPIRDYDRYETFATYIKGFLLPDSYAPTVGYITPVNGADSVAFNEKIEVQLVANAKVDIEEVKTHVKVKNSEGALVSGSWSTDKSEFSNLFTFVPEKLEIGKTYTVTVEAGLEDINGVALKEGKSVSFNAEGMAGSWAIADTYVSTSEPDKSFASEDALVIGKSGTGEKIALVSFESDIIEKAGDLTLVLPNVSGSFPSVSVSVIDNFKVDNNTTYNSAKDKIDNAAVVTKLPVSDGVVRIGADELVSYIGGENFTFVLRADPTEEPHSFSQPFDEALHGFNSANTDPATILANEGIARDVLQYQVFSSYYDYSVGYNGSPGDLVITQDSERGSVIKLTRANGRYRFHNSISTRTLTTADKGRSFEITFWAKAVKGSSATTDTTTFTYGLMRPKSSQIRGTTVTLNPTWTKYTFTVTVDDTMLSIEYDNINNQQAMFAFVTPGTTGFTYYIDDITVREVVDDVYVDSIEKGSVSAFIYSTTEEKNIKAVKDTYVSKANPDKNYGKNHSLLVTGGEDEMIGLVSFSIVGMASSDAASVFIPVNNDGSAKLKVSYIKNYSIDEMGATYNSVADVIKSAVAIGTFEAKKGGITVDLAPYIKEIASGFYFTLVIESVDSASHVLELDFEEYDLGTIASFTSSSTIPTTYYNGDYIGIRGYNSFSPSDEEAITVKAEENGNKYASLLTATSNASRWGFLNGMNHRALTQADLGKTLHFSAKIRLSEGYSAGSFTYAIRDWSAGKWLNSSNKTVNLSDNNWVTVSLSYTITQADIDGTVKPMFTIEFHAKNGSVGYDVDDVRVLQKDANGKELVIDIGSVENVGRGDSVSLTHFSYESYKNKVLADAYLLEGKGYGNTESLMLKGELGKNAVLFTSFTASSLENGSLLKLPTEGLCDGQIISVAIADGMVVNEDNFSKEQADSIIANAQFVGRYTLDIDSPYIDLSSVKDVVKGKVFTIIMQADEKHEYIEDFENLTKTLKNSDSVNAPFNSNYLMRTGGYTAGCNATVESVTAGGETSKVFKVTKGGMRFKFYNTITDDYLTVLDLGRKYNISYDIYSTAEVSDSYYYSSLKAAANGDGGANGPSIGDTELTTNHYIFKNEINSSAGEWNNVSYDISFDPSASFKLTNGKTYSLKTVLVDYQAAMLTFDFIKKGDADYYCIDNITITEIGGNEGVTTSTFASKESGKATMCFVSFEASALELDEKLAVLETEVAIGDGASEIFLVSADNTHSLLSLDSETGKLFFKKNGASYILCNADGEEYVIGETKVPVAAIYDSEKGTVRYAVDGTLAYYKDGDDIVNTYGLELVNKLEKQSVSVGSAGGALAISVSKIAGEGAEVIGTQTSVAESAVRVVAGVDSLYYTQIGFVVKYNDKETVTKTSTVFGSIEADGQTVTAEELGSAFLSTLAIRALDQDENIEGKTFTVTPVVNIGEIEIAGETVTYRISIESGAIAVAEVAE